MRSELSKTKVRLKSLLKKFERLKKNLLATACRLGNKKISAIFLKLKAIKKHR
jgi:hypothetical protein